VSGYAIITQGAELLTKAYQQEMEELQRLKKADDQLKETFLDTVKRK